MTHSSTVTKSARNTWNQAFALLSLLLFAGAAIVPAQDDGTAGVEAAAPDATLVVTDDLGQRVRMAVPAAKYQSVFPPAARRAAEELERTLLDDLEFSGVFSLQTAEELQSLQLTGEQEHDFELYRSLGNTVVLLMDLSLDADNKITLEGRVFDLAGRSMILGKRYRGSFDIARRVAHTMNDEIILYFTGQRGIGLTSVAFTSDRDGVGNKELYIMDYDGYDQRRITGHESLTFTPAWSPDGSGLAYTSYYELTPSLYWADRNTGKKSRILVDDVQTMSPDVSPDGQWIAIAHRTPDGRRFDIAQVEIATGDQRTLTTAPGSHESPTFSPDGRFIAYESNRTGNKQIFLMTSDGRPVRQLTRRGQNFDPSWSGYLY